MIELLERPRCRRWCEAWARAGGMLIMAEYDDDGSCDNSGDGRLWFRGRLLALNHIKPLAFRGWALRSVGQARVSVVWRAGRVSFEREWRSGRCAAACMHASVSGLVA